MKPNFAIGIDVGTHTGIAIWNVYGRHFAKIETMPIHKALEVVKQYHAGNHPIIVMVEDARQVRFKTSPEKSQEAGYVKAHSQIWEAFLKDNNIQHQMRRPNKAITKWSADKFKTATGYLGRTDAHNRDAALLVYDY